MLVCQVSTSLNNRELSAIEAVRTSRHCPICNSFIPRITGLQEVDKMKDVSWWGFPHNGLLVVHRDRWAKFVKVQQGVLHLD